MTVATRKDQLKQLFSAAVSAVSGRQAVNSAIANDSSFTPDLIVAVGKAAVGMTRGALDVWPSCKALVVTKYDHVGDELKDFPQVTVLESAHPVPDQNSLIAGAQLLRTIQSLGNDSRVLLLVSGGASALAEALPEEMTLDDLQAITDEMLATGKTIGQINARRKEFSLIKDGKLIEQFGGQAMRVYAISDVEGDSISVIGSGIGDSYRAADRSVSKIIASNQIARQAVAEESRSLGLDLKQNSETLYGDVFELTSMLGPQIAGLTSGVYVWGGEPTVVLPDNPGRGGRNQSLALALSEHISGRQDVSILVAGTDGTDGPTNAAGGLVDGSTWEQEAARSALQRADAGNYLSEHDVLYVTGPTNTNVMDLVITIVD